VDLSLCRHWLPFQRQCEGLKNYVFFSKYIYVCFCGATEVCNRGQTLRINAKCVFLGSWEHVHRYMIIVSGHVLLEGFKTGVPHRSQKWSLAVGLVIAV
jgi:hypothetical protein